MLTKSACWTLEQSAQAARTIVRDSGDGKVQTLGAVEHSPVIYLGRSDCKA